MGFNRKNLIWLNVFFNLELEIEFEIEVSFLMEVGNNWLEAH
jgi:hypothetical protein